MRQYGWKIIAFLWFVSTGPVFAQSADSTTPVNLEKIVVTASRTPQNPDEITRTVDVITSQDIAESAAQDLSELLTQLTSVNINSYGGPGAVKTLRMRGSTASQVLILMDGRPLNNPRDGEVDLTLIPLGNIERVEVVHGPGSSLYGQGAMGGVINIITKNPPLKGHEAQLSTQYGTFHTTLERLLYGAAAGDLGALVTGEYGYSGGYRENSAYETKNGTAKITYRINDNNNLVFSTGLINQLTETPGSTAYPDADDKQKTVKYFYDLDWMLEPHQDASVHVKIYQTDEQLAFMEHSTTFTKSVHATKSIGADLQGSYRFLENLLGLAGFNYVINANDSTDTGKHKYNLKAGFLGMQWDAVNNLHIDAGIRVDDYSNFGSEISPSLSCAYGFNDRLTLRSAVGRSFRAPTFNELYWPNDGWSQGNPDLRPETGLTGEIGADIRWLDKVETGLTFYRTEYDDLIIWAEDTPYFWTAKNVDRALTYGLECQNTITLTDRLSYELNYTFLSAKDRSTHKNLAYRPQHKIDHKLTWRDDRGLICSATAEWVGARFSDSANTTKVKGYFVLGLNVSKTIGRYATYFARIDNVLAKKYEIINGYPQPGFMFSNGIKLEF
ncbi:MAG: TonB-dependent receptor [Candidatus Omnitrophica bacterium]|nr:TonB-dependent receptor [Candidatus Omnitrophota bacterium]